VAQASLIIESDSGETEVVQEAAKLQPRQSIGWILRIQTSTQ
jgi:hypothetical protein